MLTSIWNNSLWYRILVLLVWLAVLFWLNYFLFAYFMWKSYSVYLVVLWIFLAIILWYLLRNAKYRYTIKDWFLFIKTPSRQYKIPLKDIQKIWEITNIPLSYKLGLKFDTTNKILYLCGFTDKGIILALPTHDIVIAPRKYEEFKRELRA